MVGGAVADAGSSVRETIDTNDREVVDYAGRSKGSAVGGFLVEGIGEENRDPVAGITGSSVVGGIRATVDATVWDGGAWFMRSGGSGAVEETRAAVGPAVGDEVPGR